MSRLTGKLFLAALGGAPWRLSAGKVVAQINANQLSNVDGFLVKHSTGVRFSIGDHYCWVSFVGSELEWRLSVLERLDQYARLPTWIIEHDDGFVALWQLAAPAPPADREAVSRKLALALDALPSTEHTAPLPGAGARLVDRSTASKAFELPTPYALDKLVVPKRRPVDPAEVAEATASHGGLIAELNAKHCVLTQEGGKTRVLSWEPSELDPSRESPVLQSFDDFRNRYMHRTVQVPAERGIRNVPLGEWWLRHSDRREYLGLRFDPAGGEVVGGGYRNLWRGFGTEPREGDWTRLRAHVLDVLAAGDAACAEYITRWCAWALQNPGEPAEVALVFKGKRGTGKSIFCRALKQLFGQHGMQVTSPMQLTGRFNAHLRDCCLLFADEAIAPGDKAAESVLKGLITEPELAIEGKGVNVVMARNRLHVVMASNDGWVIPAGVDERRFAVFEVSDVHAQRHAYFKALNNELEDGGLAAMLYDLLTLDLDGWHPRQGVPQTTALAEQKSRSLRGPDGHVRAMLQSGTAHGHLRSEGESVFVSTALCGKAMGLDARDLTALGLSLAKAGGRTDRILVGDGHNMQRGRQRGYWLPKLTEARRLWARSMGFNVPWPSDDGQWDQADDPTNGDGRVF